MHQSLVRPELNHGSVRLQSENTVWIFWRITGSRESINWQHAHVRRRLQTNQGQVQVDSAHVGDDDRT